MKGQILTSWVAPGEGAPLSALVSAANGTFNERVHKTDLAVAKRHLSKMVSAHGETAVTNLSIRPGQIGSYDLRRLAHVEVSK